MVSHSGDLVAICAEQNLTDGEEYEDWRTVDESVFSTESRDYIHIVSTWKRNLSVFRLLLTDCNNFQIAPTISDKDFGFLPVPQLPLDYLTGEGIPNRLRN